MPSPTVQYQYANGASNSTRLTSVTYPNGRVVNYGYGSSGDVNDAASRLTSIADGSTTRASYEYLGMGTVARVNYPEPSIENVLADGNTNPNTGDIYTGLDQFGRIIDCYWRKYSSPTADIERVNYTYDRVGNRLTRKNLVAATTSNNFWDEKYTYDSLYRLTDAKRGTLTSGGSISPLKFEQSWTLDATGNWSQFNQDDTGDGNWDLQQTRTASKVNAITDISETAGPSWATPAYDANGNMTTIPKTDDPTTTYTAKYDAWNRLVKLTSGGTTVQENAYDGRGYRTIRKTYTGGALSETRHFYYTEGWQCVEERLGTTPSSASPDRHFVWGVRYIDDLILRDRSVSGTLDERLYAQQDANWNVTTLSSTTSLVQQRFAYNAYGLPTTLNASFISSSSTLAWDYLFVAYRFDDSTHAYHVRARVLSPSIGTWLQRDPVSAFSVINRYQYANSGPFTNVDPAGLQEFRGPGGISRMPGIDFDTPPPRVPVSSMPSRQYLLMHGQRNANGDIVIMSMPPQEVGTLSVEVETCCSDAGHAAPAIITLGIELETTGALRIDYSKLAARLGELKKSPDEIDAIRDVIKMHFREKQTTLGKAYTQQLLRQRKTTGQGPKGAGNPTKTNAKVNSQAKVMKSCGKVMKFGGVVVQSYLLYDAIESAPEGQKLQAAAKAGGGILGGFGGAKLGGLAGAPLGPWGVAGGMIGGGILGSIGGEEAVEGVMTIPPPKDHGHISDFGFWNK